MKNYAKTILSAYNQIAGMITQIENTITHRAKNSFYMRYDTVTLAEQLITLGEIRKDLIELKYIADEIFNKIKQEDAILLKYKYLGITPSDENFDHTSRNYFRKQIKALERFANKLTAGGYDEEWFKGKYLKIAFISAVYKKTLLEEGKKHVRF